MNRSTESQIIQQSLAKPELHQQWISEFYGDRNRKYYDLAYDYIVKFIDTSNGKNILDAGCGNAIHSIQLARRGISNITAVDFSAAVLEMAKKNARQAGLDQHVDFQQQNVTALNFADNSFDHVFCWGVLMHIPEIEKAIAELARVLKPGGVMIVSEANVKSLEVATFRLLKKFFGKRTTRLSQVPQGLEIRMPSPAGEFFTRRADIQWLVAEFSHHNIQLKQRKAAQFTEFYNELQQRWLKSSVQLFNECWFKYIGLPQLAFGNLLVLEKGVTDFF